MSASILCEHCQVCFKYPHLYEEHLPCSKRHAVEVSAHDTEDSLAVLEQKLAAAEKEKKDNYDRFLRAAADLENTRKRTQREVDDAKLESKQRVLKEILPVVDNLERAVDHANITNDSDPTLKATIEGVQLVLRQFVTAFERLDVSTVPAEGQSFDPHLHEAISQLESDKPPGTVIQVLQRGYRAADRLLRPALVVVAKAKADAP